MPARSTEGKSGVKGVLDKLRARRPAVRTTNKRTRNLPGSQMQCSSGMIVTMSVEQSSGISLNTAECVTASHTRQVSTTSTLFSPLGVSIGVVCESTTENKEVIMDCLNDVGSAALNWNGENEINSCPLDFRKSLHFLDDQQFRILFDFNINNVQQILNMPIRKLLEMNLTIDQLQSLLTMLQNGMCNGTKPMDLSTENIQSLKKIQEELEKIDATYDDDDQPLVIDESIPINEENKIVNTKEHSLDAIEENFSKIKKVKIPKTRAALKGVKTELTEIITELNAKESKLLCQLQQNKQSSESTTKNEASTGSVPEEIVTTTSKASLTNLLNTDSTDFKPTIALDETGKLAKPAKRARKGPRTVKRRRNSKNNNLKSDNTITNNNIDENIATEATADLKAPTSIEPKTPETPKPATDTSAVTVNLESSQSFDVATTASGCSSLSILDSTGATIGSPLSTLDTTTSATAGSPFSIVDATTSKNASNLNRGVVFIHPQTVVILHEDVAKSTPLLHSPIIKKRPKRRQLNLSTANSAVLLDVSKSNIIATTSDQLFATTNLSPIGALSLSQEDIDEQPKTLPKGHTDCKVVVPTISKHLKPFSASPTTQTKLQPTVLIKKLPTPKRAKEHNVDADSTTASIEQISVGKVGAAETDAAEKSCTELAKAKKAKLVKPQKDDKKHLSDISDDDEQLAICASDEPPLTENQIAKANTLAQSPANESKQNETNKSVSLISPLFESIKSESDLLEESGIISMDNHNSSNKKNDIEQDSPSTSQKLIEDDKIEEPKKRLHSTPIEYNKDSTPRPQQLAAQRCIEFDTSSQEKSKSDYDSYDADSIVTISSTPLSPISSGIASPINSKLVLSDFRNAMEIDAYCVGMRYFLIEIDVPKIAVNKPDDLEVLMRKNPTDPRLSNHSKKNMSVVRMPPSSLSVYNNAVNQIDPRRPTSIYNTESFLNPRPQPEPPQTTPNMLLYGCLQRSPWYQSLMSTMKIQINQTISVLVRAINNFQKIRLEDPYAVFDIFKLYCAGELLEIMDNLGLFVDVNGIIAEKKGISSFAGRSYGCSSVVNATYSFIQPVVEPSTVTVQQMRTFTAPQQTYATAAQATFPTPQTPFISCYIESPQMPIEKPAQYQQQEQPTEHQEPQYNQRPQQYQQQKRYTPMSRPSRPPRGGGQYSSGPRRHCGTKVPYSYGGSRGGRSSVSPSKDTPQTYGAYRARSSVSPAKDAPKTYGEFRGRSSVSPVKDSPFSSSAPSGRSSVSPIKERSHSNSAPPARSSLSPEKDPPHSDSAPPAVSPVRQQPRCSDSEGESWD